MRLEFVCVAGQGLEIGDAIIARAGPEDVVEGQGGEGGVAAGAAAADHQALRVGASGADEVTRAIDAILDIDDAPLSIETIAIFAPIAAAAAVIHIEHADAAARPILDPQVERRRRRGGRAALALYQERGVLPRRRRPGGVFLLLGGSLGRCAAPPLPTA